MTKQLFIFLLLSFFIENALIAQNNQWVWMKGDSSLTSTRSGVYGTQGVPSALNRPGSRENAVTWTDASGNFWLFGGEGFTETDSYGNLNDLWKYNPSTNQWTWVKGDKIKNVFGIYGSVTVPALSNKPGSRKGAVSWTDASGNFWLFGGEGYSENHGYPYLLNDLWKYNPSTNEWTWMKGDKINNVNGVYGTVTVSATLNKPGSRSGSVSWSDASGNLWLFGGYGFPETSSYSYLNDLWKYNPTTNEWTWMKGDKIIGVNGVYGTQGVFAAGNKPGSRQQGVAWRDINGIVWLFGGEGYPETGFYGYLNDLWKYDPATNQWAWMKGDKTTGVYGVYGTQSVPAVGNKPGSRYYATGLSDASGNLLLFGGYGYSETDYAYLNDLWKYDRATNQWTWMKGDKTAYGASVYGQQNIFNTNNKPGGRRSMAVWKDAIGMFWIYGGNCNELWKYDPILNRWAWVRDYAYEGFKGIYGTQGVEAANNKPGSRYGACEWIDATGNLWLFGGIGAGGMFADGNLNDMWRLNLSTNQWTWIKGDSIADKVGVYGTQGIFAVANHPGARAKAVSWKDNNGIFWLFGGNGYSETDQGYLNDLWKYDPAINQWAWVKGDKTTYINGIYGTQGNQSSGNKPGSRHGAVGWADASGNLFLFGGEGNGEADFGYLNDLWRFNIAAGQWTWMKGYKYTNSSGQYGVKGTANAANTPAGKFEATGWTGNAGNLWLFGGYGNDISGFTTGSQNNLWKYSISNNEWTWIKGDSGSDSASIFGTQGTSGNAFNPAGRQAAKGWTDANNNLWLFGGMPHSSSSFYNDLWKYNATTNKWAWIKGATTSNFNYGQYGTIGVPSPQNNPGGKTNASVWRSTTNDFWLFGGYGIGTSYPAITEGNLNDIWKFSPCTAELSITPDGGNFCFGSSILLTVSGGSGTYEWYKNGILIPGVTGTTCDATSSGSYYAKSIVGSCTLFSNEVILDPGTTPPALGGSGVYCLGNNVNVGIPQTEVDQIYLWRQNGAGAYGPIGGNGGNQSLNFNMTESRVGTYIVESTQPGCNTVYSNTVYVGLAVVNNLATVYICSDGVTFNWKRTAPINISQSYHYAVTQSITPPDNGTVTNDSIISVGSLSPSTQYYIHARATCNFGSSYGDWSTISFTTTATGGPCEWIGAANTDWFNPQNWKCGNVPTTTSEVVINGGRTFYPNVTSNMTIKKITLNSGATMQVAPGVVINITSQ
ncbi:MAG: hypothetical protein E6H07_10780 [Bacteroidetes bacterium]|nr:MAG: hypothetical protein E6H07_10780 [Bacteroidota bacterium]